MAGSPRGEHPAGSDDHAAVGSYVVHGLGVEERAAFERHLVGCTACRVEVGELVETVAELSRLASRRPPAALGSRIQAGVQRQRPLPPSRASGPGARRRPPAEPASTLVQPPRPSRHRLVALTLVLTLGLGGVGAGLAHRHQHQLQAAGAAQENRLMTAADVTVHRTVLAGGHPVTLVVSQDQDRALLVAAALPPLDQGHSYQLWMQDRLGTMAPGPAFGSAERDRVWLSSRVTDAVAVALSVEPRGGSTHPSTGAQVIASF